MKRSIYVIEDNCEFSQVVTEALSSTYQITQFFSPTPALQALLDLKDLDRQPEVLIVDYRLPEMDGLELVRRLNIQRVQIPVILISGYLLDQEVMVEAFNLGVLSVLQKPFDLTDITRAVNVSSCLQQTRRMWKHLRQAHEKAMGVFRQLTTDNELRFGALEDQLFTEGTPSFSFIQRQKYFQACMEQPRLMEAMNDAEQEVKKLDEEFSQTLRGLLQMANQTVYSAASARLWLQEEEKNLRTQEQVMVAIKK